MNYQDWKIRNPNKSINDYYIAFPEKNSQIVTVVPSIATTNNVPKRAKEKAIDYLLILASILIIVAFFMPWVNIKFLGVDLVNNSGADIPKILRYVYSDAPRLEHFVKTIYLIPSGAFLVVLGETAKIFPIKAIGKILVLILTCTWFYTLYAMANHVINQFGINISLGNFYALGMYLTLGGSLYYFVDIIKTFFD